MNIRRLGLIMALLGFSSLPALGEGFPSCLTAPNDGSNEQDPPMTEPYTVPAGGFGFSASGGMVLGGGGDSFGAGDTIEVYRSAVTLVFQPGTTETQKCELYNRWNFYDVDENDDLNGAYVVYGQDMPINTAIGALLQEPTIQSAEPVLLDGPADITPPSDPLWQYQYYLSRSRALAGWDQSQGGTKGDATWRVGVMGSGVERSHEDLQPNGSVVQLDPYGISCVNQKVIRPGLIVKWYPTCRYGLGYGDINAPDFCPGCDLFTWNYDARQHETAVAGVVGAQTNNAKGMAGSAWYVTLFPIRLAPLRSSDPNKNLRFYDRGSEGKALRLLQNNVINLRTLNMSFSGLGRDRSIEDRLFTLQRAWDVVLLGSAGNHNCATPEYPAGYPVPGSPWPEVLGVAGLMPADATRDCRWVTDPFTTCDQTVGSGSNYGTWTEVSSYAPNIETLYFTASDPNAYQSWAGGTSFAAPIVSGVAHLYMSKYSGDHHDVREYWIENGSVQYPPPPFCDSSGALPRGRVDFACVVKQINPCTGQ